MHINALACKDRSNLLSNLHQSLGRHSCLGVCTVIGKIKLKLKDRSSQQESNLSLCCEGDRL